MKAALGQIPPKICIFCGGPASSKRKSKEHVIPNWLLERLKIVHEPLTQGKLEFEGTHQIGATLNLGSFQLGRRVCRQCNNGWMSDLECAVEPILWPLFTGNRITLGHLSAGERAILGRWVAKTGYVLSHIPKMEIKVPASHLQAIRRNEWPNDPLVCTFSGCSTIPHAYRYFSGSLWSVIRSGEQRPVELLHHMIAASYNIVFQLEWFVFAVAYIADPNFSFGIFEKIHDPIWPPDSKLRRLGEFSPTVVTEFTYFNEMVESLAAVEDTWTEDDKLSGPVRRFKVDPIN